jgi:hypothetical protein
MSDIERKSFPLLDASAAYTEVTYAILFNAEVGQTSVAKQIPFEASVAAPPQISAEMPDNDQNNTGSGLPEFSSTAGAFAVVSIHQDIECCRLR